MPNASEVSVVSDASGVLSGREFPALTPLSAIVSDDAGAGVGFGSVDFASEKWEDFLKT